MSSYVQYLRYDYDLIMKQSEHYQSSKYKPLRQG